MGDAVIDPVTRTVPPPNRAVVQAQRIEFRRLAAGERFERVFLNLFSQDDAESRDLFAKDFDGRIFDPALTKTHAGRVASRLPRARTLVGRVLEQRDPSLAPQSMADEQRRICGDCQQRRGDRLRQVVEAGGILPAPPPKKPEAAATDIPQYIVSRAVKLAQAPPM